MQKHLNSSLLDLIKNNQILPPHPVGPKSTVTYLEFSGTDTLELFNENLKTQPKDWIYRHKKVEYFLNSDFYRTQEFKDIDWAEAVVIFGCSNVFGLGLDEEDTVSHRLSQLLKRPVINLGVRSSSMMFALHNSLMLHDGYPTPKAVVQVWSSSLRTVYYATTGIMHYGPWNLEKNTGFGSYMGMWSANLFNPLSHALFISKMSKQLWNNQTAYYEASFFGDTAELIGCDSIPTPDAGKARDLMHFGPLTMETAAMQIAKNLKL